ncbi:growth/differentiation factor 3-like isoform X2 [Artemia franciscana]|uniref:growth/differentiation factor 3-like isoform X2 n=1 Tax=Artemia franciscana TaxID=6661 RepID=UPI0032DABE50
MVDLYEQAVNGEFKNEIINPYNATVVRSIVGKGQSCGITYFSLGSYENEILLGAVLHMSFDRNSSAPNKVILREKTQKSWSTISSDEGYHGEGLVVFDVKDYVGPNSKGLAIKISENQIPKDSYLLMYSIIADSLQIDEKRLKRSVFSSDAGCHKFDMMVDFEKIGWDSWIISPRRFNGYRCGGECEFPVREESQPTNHATIQSVLREMSNKNDIPAPCCTPSKLLPLTMLFYDSDDNVVLKPYDDMIVVECGCQ